MHEQLLYLVEALTGYSSALPGSSSKDAGALDIPPGVHLAPSKSTFRISIFEDLHFGEDEDSLWAPAQDSASLNVMATILLAESPDLVVLNGDLITGENTCAENSTSYLDMLLGPIVGSNIQFATVYGNHDNDKNISTSALYAREKARYPQHSLTRSLVPGSESDVGVSNYFLPVFFSGSTSWQPDLLLWFFDSKGGKEYKPGSSSQGAQITGRVDEKVVDWFKIASAALKGYYGVEIPSLAFVHIPVSVMAEYQAMLLRWQPQKYPGMNQDDPMDTQQDDSAFLNALQDDESVKGVFFAHDHGDDWCMPFDKPGSGNKRFFCLGRHTGYGGYSNWMRGSRTVEVDVEGLKKGELKTWIRLEDGSAGQTVMLNSTYGEDIYPVVPKRCSKAGLGEVPCDGI